MDGIIQFGGAASKCAHDSRSSFVDRAGLSRAEYEKQCEVNTQIVALVEVVVFLVCTGFTSGLAWSYNCYLYETNQWTKFQDVATVVDELEKETRKKYERRQLRMQERAKLEKITKKKKKKKKNLRQRTPPDQMKYSPARLPSTRSIQRSILGDLKDDPVNIEINITK